MDPMRIAAALAASLLLLLPSCSTDADPQPDAAAPDTTPSSTPPPESPLTGQWLVHLRRDRAAQLLKRPGSGSGATSSSRQKVGRPRTSP